MKRYIYTLCVILVGSSCLLSCFGDDKDTDKTVYYETTVLNMELLAVNRTYHTISSKGEDSVYYKKVTDLPDLTVDEANRKIYNTDSLPYNSDLSRVLVQIETSPLTGGLFWKDPDSEDIIFYSNIDSVDFTKPRELQAYNNDGKLYRSYTVTLNKHQQNNVGKLVWESRPADEYPTAQEQEEARWKKIVEEAGLKTFVGAARDEAYAYSKDNLLMVTHDDGNTWEEEDLDSDASLLPLESFSFVSYPMKADADDDYVLLVGRNDAHPEGCGVWFKTVEDSQYDVKNRWVYMPIQAYNKYYLPDYEENELVYFANAVMAFNSQEIYISRDGGITWKIYEDRFDYPDDIDLPTMISVTTANGYLWLKDDSEGKVWRGSYLEK